MQVRQLKQTVQVLCLLVGKLTQFSQILSNGRVKRSRGGFQHAARVDRVDMEEEAPRPPQAASTGSRGDMLKFVCKEWSYKAICGNKLYACLLRIMSHRFVVSGLNTLLGLHLGSGFYTLEYKNETRFLIYFIHLYSTFLCCQQDPFIFLHFWIPAPCELEQETLADAAKTGNYIAACMRARPWSSSLRRSVLQSRSLRAAARARLA